MDKDFHECYLIILFLLSGCSSVLFALEAMSIDLHENVEDMPMGKRFARHALVSLLTMWASDSALLLLHDIHRPIYWVLPVGGMFLFCVIYMFWLWKGRDLYCFLRERLHRKNTLVDMLYGPEDVSANIGLEADKDIEH